jgi:pimeloyl-ACP methyl ester carboxylesterase
MDARDELRGGTLEVIGSNLYYEVRGSGPTLLLIHGTGGDAGHFKEVSDLLADEFTVTTYDRRGNGRSPKSSSQSASSVRQHADDAAALVRGLGLAPVAVYGHNAGASTLLELVIRHAGLLRGAVVHEPPLVTVLEDPGAAMAYLDVALREAGGGPQAMYAAFVRAQEPALWDAVHPDTRKRLLANAVHFAAEEAEVFAGYRPDEALLSRRRVPLTIIQGTQSTPHHHEANRWVAARTGADVVEIPGGHWPFLELPAAFVEAIRPFLRQVSLGHTLRVQVQRERRE